MEFLEKELEEIIFNSSSEELKNRGLKIQGKPYRQLRIGNYGIADLVYFKKNREEYNHVVPYLNINVCELKKDKAGISAFLQALRYVRGIKSYLDKRFNYCFNYKFEITLIAPKIDTNSDYIYLSDLISSDEIHCITSINNYSVEYDINGIFFNEVGNYDLVDKGF